MNWLSSLSMTLLTLLSTSIGYAQDDPYQDYNRHMMTIDDTFDRAVFKPIATLYQTLTPSIARAGVNNFFSNLQEIPTVLNDVLQGQGKAGLQDTGRFLLNTTVGVGGLFDVASRAGLGPHVLDFGLTLAKWGYTSSHYLVLPLFGPSTIRDSLGLVVDEATNIYPYIGDDQVRYSLSGSRLISERANLLRYNGVQKIAFDPYLALRNAYLQNRQQKIDQVRGVKTTA